MTYVWLRAGLQGLKISFSEKKKKKERKKERKEKEKVKKLQNIFYTSGILKKCMRL